MFWEKSQVVKLLNIRQAVRLQPLDMVAAALWIAAYTRSTSEVNTADQG